MKRLLQESEEEIMVTLGPSSRVSPDKAKAETVCGNKNKSSDSTGSLLEDNSLPPCCGSAASAIGGDRGRDLAQPGSFGQQTSNQLPLGSTASASGPASRDLSPASLATSCEEPLERNQAKPLLSRGLDEGYGHQQREPLGDVVEYIIRELQGISRLQTEIAELQQHLSQVRGSVDEVSTCVDSVLSEIGGLHMGSSSLAKMCEGEKVQDVDRPSEEAVLYLYGLPEEDGENTMELVDSFLAKHLCVNGMQCNRYIREAYRAGTAPGPRPAVVKLARLEHRDFILQQSILLQNVGVRITTREKPSCLQSPQNSQKKSMSFLQQQFPDCWNSLSQDKPALQVETGNSGSIMGSFQMKAQSQYQEHRLVERQGASLLLKNNPAKQSEVPKPGYAIKGAWGQSEILRGNCGELGGREASVTTCHQIEDSGKSRLLEQCSQELETCKVAKTKNDSNTKDEASSCLSLSGLLKTERTSVGDKLLSCDTGLDILSPKQLEDLMADNSRKRTALSCSNLMEEIVMGPTTFGDMVHIDLNEDEECSAQVLTDVFDKSSCVMGGLQEDEEIKFYTSKLGRAIHHFRSALQGVFQKLENSPEDLESNESGSQSENSDRFAGAVSSGGAQGCPVESPVSQRSESLLSVVSGGLGTSTQEDQTPKDPSSFSLASNNSPLAISSQSFALTPCLGSETCSTPESPKQGRPSLEQVCTETIYLNKCISNFKNVLREKRLRQKKLLHELVQKANLLSVEDVPSDS